MTVQERMAAAARDPRARLRWRVLRELQLAPWSWQGRRLSDGEVIRCAVNLLLDRAPEAVDTGANPGFDLERFEELREHAQA